MQKIKLKSIVSFLLLIFIALIIFSSTSIAGSATSYTMTLDENGELVRTQDAYLPDSTVMNLGLVDANDIFIDKDNQIYIADTSNNRVVVYDINQNKQNYIITNEEFKSPQGVFVSENKLYVADTSAESIFIFDTNSKGKLLSKIHGIESPSYNRPFRPMKVSVDVSGNIYTLSEGVYDGIIQLSSSGEFLGFFTSNKVNLSFVEMMQDLFFTEAQQANLFARTPQTFSNLFTDKDGILLTTTVGGNIRQSVKKHNTAGKNMLNPSIPVDKLVDIYTDNNGIIYTVSSDGYIYIYSSEGEFVHLFGAASTTMDIAGIFAGLRSIAVDSTGIIWTLDKAKGLLQSFKPTEYANLIYDALSSYSSGNYEEAIDNWQEALRLNQMSVLAHNNIAKNYFSKEEYSDSMYHSEIAGNRYYYSQAFWEIRNVWLQKNIVSAFIIIFLFVAISFIYKKLKRKLPVLQGSEQSKADRKNIPFIDDFLYAFIVMKHPSDGFYEIKKRRKGNNIVAIALYVLFFIVLIFSIIAPSFIYKKVDDRDFSLIRLLILYFGLTLLFILSNYLVTSINDGEGSFGDIFRVFSYSLMPLMIALLTNTLLSHVLTDNESFILDFIMIAAVIWSALLLWIGLQEIHVYELGENFKSLFMTIFFVVIIILVTMLFFVMGEMLMQFITALIKEGMNNAK